MRRSWRQTKSGPQTTNGLFWPEREAKTDEEVELMRPRFAITEKGLARAIEVLAACKARRRKTTATGSAKC